ncbi:hypothetical protein ACWCPM_28845 [Streptomyces sp. NPDC002309]
MPNWPKRWWTTALLCLVLYGGVPVNMGPIVEAATGATVGWWDVVSGAIQMIGFAWVAIMMTRRATNLYKEQHVTGRDDHDKVPQ